MITLQAIQTDPNQTTKWDDRTGRPYPNLASRMDFAEHQRIVLNALQLLAGDVDVDNNLAGEKLEQLKEAYDSSDQKDVLYISKGIHQVENDPHIQLRLKRGGSYYTIHLNVSASEDAPGLPERYFHWVGVQFLADHDYGQPIGKVFAYWPLNVAARDMKNHQSRRRFSIAPNDIQQKIQDIARKQQEAQEKANRAAQAQQAEANKNAAIKKIKEQLSARNWKIEGNQDAGVNKLATGKSIKVKTKKDEFLVKFEGGQLQKA
jgi:hypothetical protein